MFRLLMIDAPLYETRIVDGLVGWDSAGHIGTRVEQAVIRAVNATEASDRDYAQ
jgi:hypothetical protein